MLEPAEVELGPTEQMRTLYRLSDPALSELGLEELLDELLVRVQDALSVDTVAILLYDEEAQQLVARAAKGIEEEVKQVGRYLQPAQDPQDGRGRAGRRRRGTGIVRDPRWVASRSRISRGQGVLTSARRGAATSWLPG